MLMHRFRPFTYIDAPACPVLTERMPVRIMLLERLYLISVIGSVMSMSISDSSALSQHEYEPGVITRTIRGRIYQ